MQSRWHRGYCRLMPMHAKVMFYSLTLEMVHILHSSTSRFQADASSGQLTVSGSDGGTGDSYLWDQYMKMPRALGEWEVQTYKHIMTHLPSRPAIQFFRDIMIQMHTLVLIPYGGDIKRGQEGERDDKSEYRELVQLFGTYGWPDRFDGPAFDRGAERWEEFESVRRTSKWPRENIKSVEEGYRRACKEVHDLLVRHVDGVWDGNPEMDSEAVAGLEKKLKMWEDSVVYQKKELAECKEGVRISGSVRAEMERAWKIHLQRAINWVEKDIVTFQKNGADSRRPNLTLEDRKEKLKKLQDLFAHASELPWMVDQAMLPTKRGIYCQYF